VKEAPSGDNWAHEFNFDGYRMRARIERADVRLLSAGTPPAAAFVPWPGFCRMIERLRDAGTPWTGQIELVREWYQPQLERLYDYAAAREILRTRWGPWISNNREGRVTWRCGCYGPLARGPYRRKVSRAQRLWSVEPKILLKTPGT
jgi:hypothetical protein